jgi:O-antigen biosynthesis protein
VGEIFKAWKPSEQLRFTGERLTSEIEGQSVYEHLHRYFFARELCRGRDVLDVASGEGYGSAYLAQSVVGVDTSDEAVAHATDCYRLPNLQYVVADAAKLPFEDTSFDVVVSFETIEHLEDQTSFLKEVHRVLRPEGLFIASTPNRDVYSPVNGPVNQFHVRELTRDEFLKALRLEFNSCALYGQRPLTGTLLIADGDDGPERSQGFATFEKRDDAYFESSERLARPLYFVAVASNNGRVPDFSSAYIETGDVDASIRCRRLAGELRESIDDMQTALVSARAALATAEREAEGLLSARAALAKAEREADGLRLQVSWSSEERDFLARHLSRTYHRPWRPIKHHVNHRLLRYLSTLSALFSERMAGRFARSAQKRSPSRFDVYLARPNEVPCASVPSAPGLPPRSEEPLSPAEAAAVRLPTSDDPLVSIIIPCYGKPRLTLDCLRSIAKHPPALPFEIIVADDASGDPGVDLLRYVAGLRLTTNDSNVGFLRSCNRAATIAKGQYLFLLNNDTLVMQGWLEPLLEVFKKFPEAGLVGSKLLFEDGKLQEAGGIVWSDGSAWNYGRSDDPGKPEYNYVREADYISGCAILIPRRLWEELGGFDDRFAPGYWEDTDLAFRIRAAGKKVYYCPFSVIVHLEGRSAGTDVGSGMKAYQVTNAEKFRDRWGETLTRENFPTGTQIVRARDRSRDARIALVVDHYIPRPDQDAGSRATMAMIDCLQSERYVVKFWADNLYRDPDYAPALQRSGVEVLCGNYHSFNGWIEENGEAISLAVLNRPNIAPRYIGPLRMHTKAALVYYGHDLHFERMRMEAARVRNAQLTSDAISMEGVEKSIWKQVDLVLYFSPEETAVARAASAHAATVTPYAYDEFSGDREPPKNHEIIFVAGFAHPPNVDAAAWLANEVLDLIRQRVPDATLSIVGANPTEAVRALASARIEVTGWVTEDELRARYGRARIALVPLRFGAGVKSKVVEALREGLPLVTTSVGAQGLPGVDEFIQIADRAEGLADAAARLLVDDALWRKASLRQVEYARKHFSRAAFRQSFVEAIGSRGAEKSSSRK